MSNVKVESSNQCQISKLKSQILTFELYLAFEL